MDFSENLTSVYHLPRSFSWRTHLSIGVVTLRVSTQCRREHHSEKAVANNEQLIKNLYKSFEDSIFLGDRLKQSEFGVLMSPGQFVDPTITEPNGGEASDGMQTQALLCDDRLNTSFLYQTIPGSVSDMYKELLEFAALPRTTLNPAQQRELAEIRNWMAQKEKEYTTYRDRYDDADAAYLSEQKSPIPDEARLKRLKRRRDDAYDAWVTRGYKRDWENRQARLAHLLSGNPETYWEELRRRFRDGARLSPRGIEYQQTLLSPAVASWSDAGWTKFEGGVHDREQTASSRSTSWSGGLSVGWGLWSFGGGASGGSAHEHRRSDVSDVEIEFEYLRVRINRPWLASDVFAQRFWTWKNTHGFATISDGGNLQASVPVRPVGIMPVLTTHLIVARNVVLHADFKEWEYNMSSSYIRASSSFGFGPFRIGGSYSRSQRDEYVHGHAEHATVRIPHAQIIGFAGMLLPRTPDPNRGLPWGADADFGDRPPVAPLPGPDKMKPVTPDSDAWMREEREADMERLRSEAHTLDAATERQRQD